MRKRTKKRTIKLTAAKVQSYFNEMIRRRDKVCKVIGDGMCSGQLQCSHFYGVKGNSGLRFFPWNAFCQCAKHHLQHHNGYTTLYQDFMEENYPEALDWMRSVRGRPVRYTQEVLQEIMDACKKDDIRRVADIVRSLYVAESR